MKEGVGGMPWLCEETIAPRLEVSEWGIFSDSWGWLTLIYDVPPSFPAAQPISHQPKQNQVEGGTARIKVHPTQTISEHMPLPVDFTPSIPISLF